jgi:putative phosphoribosyl transferase
MRHAGFCKDGWRKDGWRKDGWRKDGWRKDGSRKDRVMFRDRKDAGERLAAQLLPFKDRTPVVLALPRGGVAIGFEIARLLGAPLDIVLVRKIGVPWQPELALGALADCGGGAPEIFIDERMVKALDIPPDYVREETARQLIELERRRQIYCAGRPPVEIAGRIAIVVDDGIATGATMRVALRAVRRQGPAHLVLAAPVAAAETLAALAGDADETVCVAAPEGLGAIGYYYEDFHQMSDEEVADLLARAPHAT